MQTDWFGALLADLDPNGEIPTKMRNRGAKSSPTVLSVPSGSAVDPDGLPALPFRLHRARKYLRTIDPAVWGQYGSNPTFKAARVLVHGYCLDENSALALMLTEYNPRCDPPWDVRKLQHKIQHAAEKPFNKPRGWLLMKDSGPAVSIEMPAGLLPSHPAAPAPVVAAEPSGERATDSNTGDPICVVPNKTELACNACDDDPTVLADRFMDGYTSRGRRTMAYWRGEFHEWDGAAYRTISDHDFRPTVARVVERHLKSVHAIRLEQAAKDGADTLPKLPKLSKPLVANVMLAVESRCHVAADNAPAWIAGSSGPSPHSIVATKAGLVHLPAYAAGHADAILPPTPGYFTFNAVDYSIDRQAASPVEWLKFLEQLWPDDPGGIALLQEWFGYLLTPDTSQEKILLMLGPKRAGKGTIAAVLRRLMGEANCVGTSITKLSDTHGAQALIGKSVAVMGDLRISRQKDPAPAIELLLGVSGRDEVPVNPKHLPAYSAILPLRFVILSNDMPDLPDASGALAGRYTPLRFTRTFYGKEDTGLRDRLLSDQELPGIFNWAVEGWKRLREQGRFTMPESSRELAQEIADAGSPVAEFVREECIVGPDYSVSKAELFDAWLEWCKLTSNDPETPNLFSRRLSAAASVKTKRPRFGSRQRLWTGIALHPDRGTADGDDLLPHERRNSTGPDQHVDRSTVPDGYVDLSKLLLDQPVPSTGPHGPHEMSKKSFI